MKTQFKLTAALLLLSSFILHPSSLLGQGSLTPPSAPAPTMKTLSQVEPRTAITNTGAVTISQPGSYYLTTNITVSAGSAITINADNVTLDLNGFTISSTSASPYFAGILTGDSLRNITILNGFIQSGVTNNGSGVYSGSGFGFGIVFSGAAMVNTRVAGVSVSGCLYHGIYLGGTGDSTVVEACTVRTVGAVGIFATVIKSSVALDCGDTAISGGQVSDCRGQSIVNGHGVSATTAQNCYGASGSGYGVLAVTAHNCQGSSVGGSGVSATTAQNCYGTTGASSGFGVRADIAQNCYGYNSGNGTGLYAVKVAIGCYGYANTGTGLSATIANSCRGETTSGTAQAITYKYNMP